LELFGAVVFASPSTLSSALALVARAVRFRGDAIFRGVPALAGEAERLDLERGVCADNSGGGNNLSLSMLNLGGLVIVPMTFSFDPTSMGAVSRRATIQGVMLYSSASFMAKMAENVSG
jgi:hypothetical protein